MASGRFVRDLMLKDFPFLASLASSGRASDRRIWLRVATDHFIITELSDLSKLAEFVDAMSAQLAAALATRWKSRANCRLALAFRPACLPRSCPLTPMPATTVLEHAVACDDRELDAAAASGGRRAIAVAKRRNPDRRIVNRLAAQDDVAVLIALANNPAVRLEGAALSDLVRRARRLAEQEGDRRLADALLERQPVRPEFASLFLCANPSQRIELLLAAQRSQLGRPGGFSSPMRSSTIDELEQAAVARRPERFVVLLEEALGCSRELAGAIVEDLTGEPLAVALRPWAPPTRSWCAFSSPTICRRAPATSESARWLV